MSTFIMGLVAGALIASVIFLVIARATKKERDNEKYREGFNAGYTSRWGYGSLDDGK